MTNFDPTAYFGPGFQTKEAFNRYPYIGEGAKLLCVADMRTYANKNQKPGVAVDFLVVESTDPTQPVGSMVSQTYDLTREPEFASMVSDKQRLANLLCHLEGATLDQAERVVRGFLDPRALASNVTRGKLVKAIGSNTTSKKTGKVYCNVQFSHVPQAIEDVAQKRAYLDANHPLVGRDAPQPQQPAMVAPVQPQPVAAPQMASQLPPPAPVQPAAPVGGTPSLLATWGQKA